MKYNIEAIEGCFTFEDIANSQFDIEGSINIAPYKPTYNEVWEKHKNMLEQIEFIIEDYSCYWTIFNAVQYVQWCEDIKEAIKPKRFRDYINKINDCRITIQRFSTDKINLDLPRDSNDTLFDLRDYLEKKYTIEQSRECTDLIKETFNKNKLNTSDKYKSDKKWSEIVEILQKELKK